MHAFRKATSPARSELVQRPTELPPSASRATPASASASDSAHLHFSLKAVLQVLQLILQGSDARLRAQVVWRLDLTHKTAKEARSHAGPGCWSVTYVRQEVAISHVVRLGQTSHITPRFCHDRERVCGQCMLLLVMPWGHCAGLQDMNHDKKL